MHRLTIALAALFVPALLTAQQRAIERGFVRAGEAGFRQALKQFHGEDLRGRDGPLRKADMALLRDHFALEERARRPGPPPRARAIQRQQWVDYICTRDHDAFIAELEAHGVTRIARRGNLISGLTPLRRVPELARLTRLRFMRPALAHRNVGATTSQGSPALEAPEARNEAPGFNGAGINVGILSDSFDGARGSSTDYVDDIASGDLPSDVLILEDLPNSFQNIDEGRAMAQLIADVAPGADLQFATAFTGQAGFANNILALRQSGSDVIVDDIIYFAEPAFQDGVIAQAVDEVVADGAVYFSSAGNNSDNAYDSAFRLSSQGITGLNGGLLFDFDPGGGDDVFQEVTIEPGTQVTLVLQWDEPFASASGAPGCQIDMDLIVTGSGDALFTALYAATVDNIGGDAVEVLQFRYDGRDLDGVPGTDTTFNIVIERFSQTSPGELKLIYFTSGGSLTVNEYATNSPTSYGHANAAGAVAVGAAPYFATPAFGVDPPLLEGFSARGGQPILFDTDGNRLSTPEVRPKPEIVAPDGGNTTFFGQDIDRADFPGFTLDDADSFPNFFGTSASAPHAAAVAALLLEKAGGPGSLTPEEVLTLLSDSAIDMGPPGFDNDSGAGFIQADVALAAAPLGFPAWQRLNFPASGGGGATPNTVTLVAPSAPNDDADNDGVENLLEYYAGDDPNSPSTDPLSLEVDGEVLRVRVRRADAASVSSAEVQFREALTEGTWEVIEAELVPVETTENGVILEAELPLETDGFFRLLVGL